MILFAIQSRIYAFRVGLNPKKPSFRKLLNKFTLERGIFASMTLIAISVVMAIKALTIWGQSQFGVLDARRTMRIVIPSATIFIMGAQFLFSSFFLSIMGIRSAKLDSNK